MNFFLRLPLSHVQIFLIDADYIRDQKHSILEAKYSIEVIFKLPRETADDRFLQKCAVYQHSLHN